MKLPALAELDADPPMPVDGAGLNLASLRERLAAVDEPVYWRSLEELAGTEAFRASLADEFPAAAARWDDVAGDPTSRRHFLKLMAAALGLAGLNGCFHKEPQGKIVPYHQQPEAMVPGVPMFFATAMPFGGYGRGVLVASREGRPIKIEGNPDHPASLGATDVFMQAAILDLYDPDRSREVLQAGRGSDWGVFRDAFRRRMEPKRGDGTGVRLLTGATTSPTFASQLDEFRKVFPNAAWHVHEPIHRPQSHNVIYDFSKAAVIVSFAADFLFDEPGSVRYARDFNDGRRVRGEKPKMSRLYVVEPSMTLTGAAADHRLALRPSKIESVIVALARKLEVTPVPLDTNERHSPAIDRWVDAVADDLLHPANGGPTLVLAGISLPASVHAFVHAINQRLGNIGESVRYIEPVEVQGGRSLAELTNDISAGLVDTLVIFGGNPAYSAPADIPFADALEKLSSGASGRVAPFTVHLGDYYDETSFRCEWHLPKAHWLESWGDVRAYDGTASIIQPLIAPLHGGRSEIEILEWMLGRPDRGGAEIVRDYWSAATAENHSGRFDDQWIEWLQRGAIPKTESSPVTWASSPFEQSSSQENDGFSKSLTDESSQHGLEARVTEMPPDVPTTTPNGPGEIEIFFLPDPTIWDGAFANNAWLQELPKPFTKLTWDNAILISLRMAERLGSGAALRDGDVLRVTYQGRSLEGPLMLMPGQADNVITVHLGFGREHGGRLLVDETPKGDASTPRGFNAYRLRTSDALWTGTGVKVVATGRRQLLAVTRNHHAMSTQPGVPGIESGLKPEVVASPGMTEFDLAIHNRKLIRTATLDHFKQHPNFVQDLAPEEKKPLLSLYPGWDYSKGMQWGMVIDQTACIGCNACIIACQAENNIAVVGKQEVARQREMHWIRVDNYFSGPIDEPAIHHQPVPCMHCENAPCEYVCPVGATTHSAEGINEMTYNRCVGTRYCSNNCPYKVRRFNFLLYSSYDPTRSLQYNPDVTVRSRGVMEKCNYCIQRIDRTRIESERVVIELEEQARRASDPAERDRLMHEAAEQQTRIVRRLETACQQACPAQAIVFGDLNDAGSGVKKLKQEPTNYTLLGELTTKPRTSYLAKIRNPNLHLL